MDDQDWRAPGPPASVWGPALAGAFHRAARLRHPSPRTEKAYRGWVRRYLAAHDWRPPLELGRAEVTAFLSDLATRGRISASTQNQALAAILFLYGAVLEQELPWLEEIVRAKRPQRVPVVLTRAEVRALLGHMEGRPRLVATLLYGAGLRLLEALQLRIKDVDLDARTLTIRSGKGDRDWRALCPESARPDLAAALEAAVAQHARDLERGAGWVELPQALARKYAAARRSTPWQWVFPTGTARPARPAATTCTRPSSSVPCGRPSSAPAPARERAVTPYGTPSQRTCSRTDRTSARSKSCSATRTYPRR